MKRSPTQKPNYISVLLLQPPLRACRQVMGDDFHASAIIGAQNLQADAADFGMDSDWVETEAVPHNASRSAHPTAVVLNSQHVRTLLLFTADPCLQRCKI